MNIKYISTTTILLSLFFIAMSAEPAYAGTFTTETVFEEVRSDSSDATMHYVVSVGSVIVDDRTVYGPFDGPDDEQSFSLPSICNIGHLCSVQASFDAPPTLDINISGSWWMTFGTYSETDTVIDVHTGDAIRCVPKYDPNQMVCVKM